MLHNIYCCVTEPQKIIYVHVSNRQKLISILILKCIFATMISNQIKPKKRMRTTERSKSPPAGRCVANSTASMMRRQTTVPTGRAAVTSSSMRRQTSARAIRSRGAVPPTGRQAPGATGAVSKASTKSAGGAPSGGLTNSEYIQEVRVAS